MRTCLPRTGCRRSRLCCDEQIARVVPGSTVLLIIVNWGRKRSI